MLRQPIELAIATAAVLGWGIFTLHFPSKVELTDEGVAFFGYGRVHRFSWSAVHRVKVRRFLVKDRVLVRLGPSPAWRGRYWIVDGIDGFDALVSELHRREASSSTTPTSAATEAPQAARLPR